MAKIIQADKLKMKQMALSSAIFRLKELCGDDDDLLTDMIEGEIDLECFADQVVEQVLFDKAMTEAIDAIISKYQARKSRLDKRINSMRDLLAVTLDSANINKIETAVSTISVRNTAPKLVVTEEGDLPSSMFKDAAPVLDKAALKKAVTDRAKAIEGLSDISDPDERKEAQEMINKQHPEIKGASLSNGGFSLTIRVL